MKIMQILPKVNLGGVERGVLDLSKCSKDKTVVVSGGGRLVEELKTAGVIHYTLPVYKKSFSSLFLIGKIKKIIKKESVEIVHARSRVPAWISFFATRNLDADFITTAHGVYSKHILSEVMGWGKFVICPSKVIARHMMQNFGVDEEKIKIITRWVDLDKFKFKDPKERLTSNSIVSIGRISPSKGFEYLIEAFREVIRTNPYLTLNIVGEPEEKKLKYFEYLKSLVRRYSLNYSVKFLGFKGDVERVLNNSLLLVVPSVVEEAFGRVVIEAFACGVPVIATKAGALEEIIKHREDGMLVLPRNPGNLAETIREVANNLPLARKLALNARKKAEKLYSLSSCVSRIEEVYREVKEFKRILVIKISSLGDLILALPSLKAIKETFPKSKLVLLTLKKHTPLCYGCPYIDKVIGINFDYKKIKNIFNIAKNLRRQSFDYIIDFQNNPVSHLITFFSFPRRSFGYARKLGFLLTSREKISPKKISPLDSQEKILKLLGIRFKEKKLTFWKIEPASLEHFGIKDKDRLIGINISASKKWRSKNWPLENTKKLIGFISKEMGNFKVVLLGDRDSMDLSRGIEVFFKKKIINLCGKTSLRDLTQVLKRLNLFVCQDTASLHLALSLGIETIGLFGPTDPLKHTVKDKKLHVFLKKMPCSFCYKPGCKNNICMKKITPQEVFVQIKQILGR